MKHIIQSVEFYITNVCNLTCTGCNRFNNYKFTGQQRWADYKEIYSQWAKEITPLNLAILGGEPTLNPDFMDWFQGLRKLWPQPMLVAVTNGYRINKVNGLYDFLLANRFNTHLSVGIHNEDHKDFIMQNIEEFLVGPIKYELVDTDPYHQYMYATDANKVKLKIEYNWWFHQGALVKLSDDPETFTLHQSNVDQAHEICHSKYCHHMMDGKLYKCGAVALFPEFANQHNVQLSDEDRELMLSYAPLTIDASYEEKKMFLENLPNAIPQCKFCPEEYHGEQIYAVEKKVKFHKKVTNG